MNADTGAKRLKSALLFSALLLMLHGTNALASISLEGQNKGDTNTWSAGNLQNWQELDFIPCRVHWTSAQGNNQAVRIDFPHRTTGIPGFQDLFYFSTS